MEAAQWRQARRAAAGAGSGLTCAPVLLDLLTVLLPLVVPFAAGLPIAWLLRGRRALEPRDWLMAPFLGLGALVLLLQNLVYVDVPVGRATPWVWAALLLLWVVFLRHPSSSPSRAACPRAALLVALAVWACQASALFLVGPRHWVGRLWEDQYGYTSMAQFFKDERYSTEIRDLGQRAWLFRVLRPSMGRFALPVTLKQNRIGQSVLQAFLAASLGRDTKPVFGPLVVLGAPLLALALVLLAGRLGLPPPLGWLAGALGGLLPAFTLLQIEGFLSHALVLGFFVAWLVALDDLGAAPTSAALAAATLVLSFGLSDYCEMWAAFLALGAVVLGAHGFEQGRLLTAVRSWGLVCLLSLALNPAFVPRLFLFSEIATTEQMHTAIYPWAYEREGLVRLWLGDLGQAEGAPLGAVADVFGLSCGALGLVGLLLLLRRDPARPSRALALGCLALALGALPLRLTGQHPYQFYKTLLTGAPALALGLVALEAALADARLRRAARALALGALAVAAVGTFDMVVPTAQRLSVPRSNAGLLLDPDVRAVGERLEQLHGEALVIGPGLRPLLTTWLAYFARGAAVWVTSPALGRDRLSQSDEALPLIDLTRAPADALVLTSTESGPRPPAGAREVWANRSFTLWQPVPGPWVLLFDCAGQRCGPLSLGREPLTLRLLSGSATGARLELERLDDGPPASLALRLRSPGRAEVSRVELIGARATLPLALEPGFSELSLTSASGGILRLAPLRLEPTAPS